MANEIVTMKFSRAGKTDASGTWWSGFFLYPIDPVIRTRQNVLVVPSPARFIPGEASQYAIFTADEIEEFNEGTLLYVGSSVKLSEDEDSTREKRTAALRVSYVKEDRDTRTRLQALRREYRRFGDRMSS